MASFIVTVGYAGQRRWSPELPLDSNPAYAASMAMMMSPMMASAPAAPVATTSQTEDESKAKG